MAASVLDCTYRLPMTPESSEGRERIVRLEGQVEDIERQVDRNERTFGPLPLAVERLQWTIDAINNRLDKRDAADDERFERLARSFENQISACADRIGKLAESQEAWHKSERDRREQSATQKFVARYGLVTGLVVVLISSLTTIGLAIFGGS